MADKADNKPWLPIARVGRWIEMRGRDLVFDVEDFERIIANYDPTRERAPLFLDAGYHTPRNGDSAGYVDELRINGDRLEARVSDVPPEVKEDVAAGRRKYVSGEFGLDSEGRPDRLLRVALLGAYLPAVKGLPPLDVAMFSEGAPVVRQTIEFEEGHMFGKDTNKPKPKPKGGDDQVAKLTAQVEELTAKLSETEAKLAAQGGNDLVAKLSTQVKELMAKLSEADQRVVGLAAENRRRELAAYCDDLTRRGQLPPGLNTEELVTFMASLSDQPAEGDGAIMLTQGDEDEPKPVSQLDYFKALLSSLPTIIKPGEHFTAPLSANDGGGVDRFAELGKKIANPDQG